MAAGMVLASLSFGLAALVQINIDDRESQYFALYNTTDVSSSNERPSLQTEQLSVLWLIPQYVVMTAGEILFSVTGLEFAFREVSCYCNAVLCLCVIPPYTIYVYSCCCISLAAVLHYSTIINYNHTYHYHR